MKLFSCFTRSNLWLAVVLISLTISWDLFASEPLPQMTDAWEIGTVWKDAKKSKAHFITGKLGIKNPASKPIQSVSAKITTIDPKGNRIDSSKSIRFGTIGAEKSKVMEFEIDKGVQFAEARIVVQYRIAGESKRAEYSSIRGQTPESITVEEGTKGVTLMALEIDAPLPTKVKSRKKRKKENALGTTVATRVRNIGSVPVENVTLTIILKHDKGEKARKAYEEYKKVGPYEVRITKAEKEETTFEIVLNSKLAPGETKSFSEISLPDAPRHAGYKSSLNAKYPEEKAEALAGIVIDTGQGEIEVANLTFAKPDPKGLVESTFDVRNASPDLPANSLILSFIFYDKSNKEIGKLDYTVPSAIAKGSTVPVKTKPLEIPKHEFYELGLSFSIDAKPAETFQVEIKEGEPIPEGVEVIEVIEQEE